MGMPEAAGESRSHQGPEEQVKFELIPKIGDERPCNYIADFTYMENGELVVEDVKGVRTDAYKIKKKLMLWVHGIRIKET